jgi:hypothetical protein
MLPWYRRAVALFKDYKLVASICAGTIAAHVYVKGLITRDDLKGAVREAVTEATAPLERRVDLVERESARTAKIVDARYR